jgi:hypothetical protein
MTYPRLLRLESAVEERLISYLDDELQKHDSERSLMLDEIIAWKNDYWAPPATAAGTFPFDGSCTLTIPTTAIAVETIHSRIITTLFALPNFVSAKAVSKAWVNSARPFERYFDHELQHSIKFRNVLEDCVLEQVKLGTTIGKAGYTRTVKYAIKEVAPGIEEEVPVVVKQGACADAVALSNFLMPFTAKNAQVAPWVGEQHSKTPYEFMLLEQSGFFAPGTRDKIEKWISVMSQGSNGERRVDAEQDEQLNMKPAWPKIIDWVELWLSFDVDGSGREKEIVIHYHRDSHTILAARYNWYDDLHRPYRIGVYFPLEHRWRGIGVCKQNEQFSAEITTQHRQRIDNATMANMRMIKISKLSDYGPNEPIFPGKMWFVDNKDDIDVIQMGEVYPSAYNNEGSSLQYSQQRTGVNDSVLGMPQAGTPGTATAELARVQEGRQKFDYYYSNTRIFTNELLGDIAVNMHQFGPRSISWFNHADGGQEAAQFFTMPAESIREGVLLDIKATGQQQNKIVDRQNWTQIAPLYQQYIMGMMQAAQLTGDQKLMMEIIQTGLRGGTEAMRQILETFDVRDLERFLIPSLADAKQIGATGIIAPAQEVGRLAAPTQAAY